MNYLGDFILGSTIRIPFSTNAADGSAVAPSSAFESADIKIYKNSSSTERASSGGVVMTSPFDSITGLHLVTIDTSNNADPGFFATGNDYSVVLSPDETVDGVAVVSTIATFSIENRNNADSPGSSTVSTYITLGPFLTKPNGLLNSSPVSGVVIDIYRGGSTVPSVGAGTYSIATNSTGKASFTFSQTVDYKGWKYRATYPAGAFDSTNPSQVLQITKDLKV